jgi:hypothetical protein
MAQDASIFTEYNIPLHFSVNQPVMAANILADKGTELLIVGVDDKQQRTLGIYGFDPQTNDFVQRDSINIANNIFAFDVGEVNGDGLQHLYLLSKNSVKRYVPAHLSRPAALFEEQKVSSMYAGDQSDLFSHKDFVHDINNDQVDDLVLADFAQLNLWLSDCCGLRHAQSLPIAARLEVNDSGVTYHQQQLYFEDMDQDTNTDIVWVQRGQLQVFLQNENKQFSAQAESIQIDDSIHAVSWWYTRKPNGQELVQSDIAHRKVVGLEDLNGDKIPDLAIEFTKSSGVLDKIIDFEFFYGVAKQGQLTYSQQANASVTSEDTLSDLTFLDIESDTKKEVMVSSFDIGISQIVGALLSGSIDRDVLIFAMGKDGIFAEKPLVTQEVEMTFSLSSGASGQPLTKVTDVNGDQVKDIVYSDGKDKIRVLLATPQGKKPYARRALKQKVVMPANSSKIVDYDLNGDGKADFVLHYGRADEPKMLKQVTVLIAN